MSSQIIDLSARMSRCMIFMIALAAGLAAPTAVWPQQQPPAPQQSPAPAPPAERGNPGLIEEIGKVLKDSAAGLRDAASGLTSNLPSPQETLEGINARARDATDNLGKITPSLPGQSVSGRAMCPLAPNGAPDCKVASDQLCREKGYKEGRSVDIETAQKCSAGAYLAGAGAAACKTENFVTRAVCQ